MVAIKATYDGRQVILPDEMPSLAPGEVILIFEEAGCDDDETNGWLKAQESAFAKAWDNDEDAVYDAL